MKSNDGNVVRREDDMICKDSPTPAELHRYLLLTVEEDRAESAGPPPSAPADTEEAR